MITREDVRRMLAQSHPFLEGAAASDDDPELALDSLTLIWLAHRLREEHHLEVDLEGADLDELTSVDSIHRWLQRSGRTPQVELDDTT